MVESSANETERLKVSFHEAMLEIYRQAKEECMYNASRFLPMIHEHGGWATARILLNSTDLQSGFIVLWECNRLDLTVEAHVLKSEFNVLFTEEEKRIAAKRLKAYGWEPTSDPRRTA